MADSKTMTSMVTLRAALCVGVTLAVAGCAAGPPPITPAPRSAATMPRGPVAAPRGPAAPAPRPAPSSDGAAARTSPAVVRVPAPAVPPASDAGTSAPASAALLAQGRNERAAGSYTAAATSIERALRIDPNNAELWLELGEIKLADDDPQQAQMMARKALTLVGASSPIAGRAQWLMERAASCAGDGC